MSLHHARALDRLGRIAGVRGAALVDSHAGVPIHGEGRADDVLAALASSLYRRAARATDSSRFGALTTLQLECEHGHLVIAGGAETLVVALVEPDAQLGLVRLEARRAAEALA